MDTELSMYKYYKGEKINPWENEDFSNDAMFWDYERIFESKYINGDFSLEAWEMPTISIATKDELKTALTSKPIDKVELFKVWLYNLLLEYLPDKHGPGDRSHYNTLYWANT